MKFGNSSLKFGFLKTLGEVFLYLNDTQVEWIIKNTRGHFLCPVLSSVGLWMPGLGFLMWDSGVCIHVFALIAVLITKLGDGTKGTREPAMLLWYPGAKFAPNYYFLSLPWEMWIFPLLSEKTPVFSFFLSTNILSCMVELSYSWFQSCQMTRMGCVKYMLEFD